MSKTEYVWQRLLEDFYHDGLDYLRNVFSDHGGVKLAPFGLKNFGPDQLKIRCMYYNRLCSVI